MIPYVVGGLGALLLLFKKKHPARRAGRGRRRPWKVICRGRVFSYSTKSRANALARFLRGRGYSCAVRRRR